MRLTVDTGTLASPASSRWLCRRARRAARTHRPVAAMTASLPTRSDNTCPNDGALWTGGTYPQLETLCSACIRATAAGEPDVAFMQAEHNVGQGWSGRSPERTSARRLQNGEQGGAVRHAQPGARVPAHLGGVRAVGAGRDVAQAGRRHADRRTRV